MDDERWAGTVRELWRHPVKSMLGEALEEAAVDERGLAGDRGHAVVDTASGKVASAKEPRLWKRLLACSAQGDADGGVRVRLPDGRVLAGPDGAADAELSSLLGRPVALHGTPPAEPELERALPEEVLRDGVDAPVTTVTLQMGAAAPPGTFLDFAPLHLVTSATLARLAALHPRGEVVPARYRPNLVLDVPGLAGFAEDGWTGRELAVGPELVVRVLVPTPRCAIPTLAHGARPRDPDALRILGEHHRVGIEGFGEAACAGAYAQVLRPGTIRRGDEVRLA